MTPPVSETKMSEWMPIETAPKDGTMWVRLKDQFRERDGCWCKFDGWVTDFGLMDPTHWKPLE